MATRWKYGNSSDVGCYVTLTNNYCLVASCVPSFNIQAKDLTVISCSVDCGNIMVGRMTAGNSKGLLVPETTTDEEMFHLRSNLPEGVKV